MPAYSHIRAYILLSTQRKVLLVMYLTHRLDYQLGRAESPLFLKTENDKITIVAFGFLTLIFSNLQNRLKVGKVSKMEYSYSKLSVQEKISQFRVFSKIKKMSFFAFFFLRFLEEL